MHKLVVIAAFFGMAGIALLLFAHSVPLMIAYSIIYGISGGIASVAVGNLYPDYYGRTEFAKIMGYTMPFNTFISGLAAPFTGYIRDLTGSYEPAFKVFFVMIVLAFVCILFAKPPLHPSLKAKAKEEKLDAQLVG
jgi:MFS family permease